MNNKLTQLNLNWVVVALISAASFAMMAACARIASQALPKTEVVFFRNAISFVLLVPMVRQRHLILRTRLPWLHLFRACTGMIAMYLYFYAIAYLPLADAVLLNYTSPLFVSLFAVLWLKEKLTPRRKLSAVLGLVGMVCLFHPSTAIASLAGLAGLLSGVAAGLALTSVKKLSNTEPGLRIVMMFAFWASVMSAVPMFWQFTMPSAQTWPWLIALGGLGTLGQLCLSQAYKLAPASQVSPLGYSGLLFALLIGFFFWRETPDAWMLVGGLLIIIAGVIVVRERKVPMPAPPSAVPDYSVKK